MDRPRPWLRYVDASDLDNSRIKFDGMTVESNLAEKLGEVDGLIVDVSSGRPYYVVVDAGGWFKSKFFLLPIGHIGLASNERSLVADVTKERVERYPGLDRGEFETLSDAELDRMATQMADACCPTDTATRDSWTTRTHYVSPSWWRADFYRAGGLASAPVAPAPAAIPSRDEVRSEDDREREEIVAQGDVSPHTGGRAQPGDVLGLETGGAETHIGDTSEDENERRRDTEQAAAKKTRG